MSSGEEFRNTTDNVRWGDRTALVQSYGDVIARYDTHAEAKSLGPDGKPCGRCTIGLLQRRPVGFSELVHIGKETNRLEEVEQGLVHDWDEVQLVFRNLRAHRSASTTNSSVRSAAQWMCLSCGTPVEGARSVYCSPACRQSACRQRKQHMIEEPRWLWRQQQWRRRSSNIEERERNRHMRETMPPDKR